MATTHHSERTAVEAAVAVRAALTTLADALTSANLASMLDAEPLLAAAAALASAAVPPPTTVDALDSAARGMLGAEVRTARAALARCVMLGRALNRFVQGRTTPSTYSASGAVVPSRARQRIFEQV